MTAKTISAGLMLMAHFGCHGTNDPAPQRTPTMIPPTRATCPTEVGPNVDCWSGQDGNGAYFWIAKPKDWNQILLVHAHGGPRLTPPEPSSPVDDLTRFAVLVKDGYAWIGSSYRRGGYGVRMAVEDSETARRIFVEQIAKPRRTIAHGQSWGGNVAAKLNELSSVGADGKKVYDAVFLTSGVLGGGTHGYDYRADLRAVYNYYCNNHPRPSEPQYALGIGLPRDSMMTDADLSARLDECTGFKQPAAQRTESQTQNLRNILNVVRMPERTFLSHMSWATFLFRDISQERLGGKNPFGNIGVTYAGSTDDAALNRGVARFAPDPAAVAQLAEDSDLTGGIKVPEVTIHAIDDPTAFVEHESRYRDVVTAAGKSDLLVQTFVDEKDHSFLTAPAYPAALRALVDWVDNGTKPTPPSIAAACPSYQAKYGSRCSFVPDYTPRSYDSRVYPR